jgi:hypothetical protein
MGDLTDDIHNYRSRKEAHAASRDRAVQEQLLHALLTEQRRTNQLLEWLGAVVQQQRSSH